MVIAEETGIRRGRQVEESNPEEPAEKYMCIEAVSTGEQYYIVDEKEKPMTRAEAQLEISLPDLNMEEIKRLAEEKGVDPDLAAAGIKKELETLISKGVYEEIDEADATPGVRVIGTTCVVTPKSATRVKGRVCAQDYHAEHRDDTFAPTPLATSLKIVLNLMRSCGWHGRLGDFTGAFLNALVDEEVFVRPPRVVHYDKKMLWKLKKALYGLRKAPALWHQCLAAMLGKIGLKQLVSDSSLYYGEISGLVVFVHVDDLLAVGDRSRIEWLFEEIQKQAEFRAEAWLGEEPVKFIGKWICYK
jgi:hypothetical protein